MSKGNWLLKAFKTIGLGLVLGISVTACGAGSEKWKEEVKLSDGRVIVIERELILESGGDEWAANRNGSKPKEYRIQFADPNDATKKIEWHSTKKSPQTWPEIPLVLDWINGEWLVFSSVAKVGGCLVYNKYLYEGGAWVEEKLPPTFEKRASNLLVVRQKTIEDFVDLKTKQRIISTHFSADRSDRYDHVGPTHPNCKGA
jgi:hypothetical protein